MGKLYFTIGCPRSGKSTLANEWARNAPMRVVVASDDIRLALTGQRYEPLAETIVFGMKHVMIRSLLSRGYDVMVDGTHSSKISLERLFEIDINAIPLYVDTDSLTCCDRALDCGHLDLPDSINRIEGNLIKLGFRDIYTVDVNNINVPVIIDGVPFDPTDRQAYAEIKKIRKEVQARNLYNNGHKYREDYWWYEDILGKVAYSNKQPIGIINYRQTEEEGSVLEVQMPFKVRN